MYCMLMMGLALLAFAVKAWMQVNVRYRPPDEKPLELRVATGRGRGFKLHQEIQIKT